MVGFIAVRVQACVSTAAIPRVASHQPCQKPKPSCDITNPAVKTDIETQHANLRSLALGTALSIRKNSIENNIRPTRPSSNQIWMSALWGCNGRACPSMGTSGCTAVPMTISSPPPGKMRAVFKPQPSIGFSRICSEENCHIIKRWTIDAGLARCSDTIETACGAIDER